MDTSKLVVGEYISIRYDIGRFTSASVTKVLSDGVEMKTTRGPMRFDTNGMACDSSVWELAFEDTDDHYPIGTKLKPLEKIPPNKSWGTKLE